MHRNTDWLVIRFALAGALLCGLGGCPFEGTQQSPNGGGAAGVGSAGTSAAGSGAAGAGAAGTASAGHAGGSSAGTSGGVSDGGGSKPAADGGTATGTTDAGGGCVRGGCSNELCGEASAGPLISDCLFRPEYACYQKAVCERQPSGSCGFTGTPELSTCLTQAGADAGSSTAGLRWYETCGAPLCRSTPVDDPNVPNCTTQTAGTACTTDAVKCDLVNDCGTMLLCTSSDPTTQGCPRSRARFKQDIAYLSPAQRQRIYQDVLTIPLAAYAYKDDPNATPQLGFLLEDVEPSPAARGDHVNLYGYLSMAVAAVQVQAQQIEALRRELESLRAARSSPAAISCEP